MRSIAGSHCEGFMKVPGREGRYCIAVLTVRLSSAMALLGGPEQDQRKEEEKQRKESTSTESFLKKNKS